MKINKRLLSFFLAVLMVVSTFGDSVYAISENVKANSANKKTEIEGKVEGNKEVFTFDLSKLKKKETAEPMSLKAMPARAPRRAPVQNDTTVNIKAEGLNGGAFDWDALPNKEFKLIAKWKTKDGQDHEKTFATITAAGTTTHNVGWPVDGTMTGNASIETSYHQNIEVRVIDVYSSSTGGAGKLVFDITLKELAEPRAEVKYVDPYGRPITDPADLPTGTMPKVTAPELTDVEIDLPNTSKQINMRSSDDIDEDELHEAGNGLTFKVDGKTTGETVTIDNKEYKLDISAPNAKEIGTIKMVYQKDVLVPPADGDGNPVAPADGYVRLTFDANEKTTDGITGTHKNGLYAGKQKSYIDVKEGVNYDNANLQAAIKELATTGTKEVNGETKTYGQDAKKPWTPVVPTDTTPVVAATYNAQYTKSAAEQVKDLGGLDPVTIKVWKGDDIDWAKGVAPKTTDKNDADLVQQLLDNAEVTDLSSRNSNEAGKFAGKLLVTFGDGSTLKVDNQWLYVWEHIVTVDPDDSDSPSEDDLPSDKVKVLFEPLPNRGVKSINTKGTTYAKKGTVFQDKDFPQDITYEDGYKGPVTWTPSHHTISKDLRKGYNKHKNAFIFRASATKLEDIIGPVNPGETPNPDAKNYWTVTFKSADEKTGTVDAKNTYYVLKTANKTLADLTAPNTTPAEGYTFNKWTPAVDDKTKVDKDIEVIGIFVKDVVPQKPGEEKPDVPDNFVKVDFSAGEHGTIAEDQTVIYWVNPDAGKTLADVEKPTVTANEGWKHTGWDKADTEEIKANLTVTAQYKEKVVTVDPGDKDYVKVDFATSKGTLEGTSEYWVLKDEEVTVKAPTVNMGTITDYKFKAWNPAVKTTYTEDTTHNATFTYSGEDIVPQPGEDKPNVPDNFVLVEFKAGDHGTFAGGAVTKYWVNPDANKTLADVTKPTVVANKDYKFTGWDKADTTEIKAALEVTAQYKEKVVTVDPGDKDYVKVDFATSKGTLEGTSEYWVLKDTEVTVPAPKVTGLTDYEFKAWDPAVKTTYTEDTTHNATFNYTGEDIIPVPDPENPPVKPEGFVDVVFDKGAHGEFADGAVTKYFVNPNAGKTLADITKPGINAAEGWKHTGWDKADTEEIKANLTVTAQYKEQNTPTKNSEDYDPHYENKSGKPGETVQIDPPTFTKTGVTGNVPAPTTPTKGTTFAKNDKTQTNVNVDHNTGAITVEIPSDAKVGDTITISVDVTYPDGSNETVEAKVTVVEDKTSVKYPDTEIEKGKTETVTPKVTDKDDKPVPENKIGTPTVTNTNDLPEGVTVTPKNNGKVDIAVPDDYNGPNEFTVKVTVPVDGKDVESEIKVTVKDKTTPTPQGPSVTYPDTDMDKGDTKTVIPEIKDKKGEPTRPDTTPEVVQPGNGVVVTPHPDGTITVTIPEGYDGPSTIVIPVVVTVDGERIHTTLTIRVRDNKPVIDYDIPELKIHEYTPTYPVFASVDKKVVEKEVINSHDQYIFGYPDDTIRPDGDMTRAEAIAVVARLQKLDLSDKSSKIYKDTKADMWYNGAINAAFREGYLLEKEGENIRPNDKITRAELAELISHIDKKNNAIAPFDDVKGHKFEAAINQAYGNGRIEGYPDGTFKPDNFITRAEVATMLNKLYDRYPDKNFIDANQNLVHNYKDMSYKGHWGYYELVEAYHGHTYLRLKDNMEEWKVIIK